MLAHPPETKELDDHTSSAYAKYVVFVLVACYALAFVDRQILSLLVGPIKRDLGLSDSRFGLLSGLAFAVLYTLMGLPLGRLVDTRNRRNIVVCGVTAWSIMTSLCSAARSFGSLFTARIGVGIGEAALSPAAFSIISDYFPKEQLGLALSIYSMGIFIGSGLALLVGGIVVDAVTLLPPVTLPVLGTIAAWRLTFVIVGVTGLLFVPLGLTIREPLRRSVLKKPDGEPAKLTLGEILIQLRMRWTSLLGISVTMIFSNASFFAFSAWVPAFFARVYAWTPGQTGKTLGFVVIAFGCTGMYAGGSLCNRWSRQGIEIAPLRVAVLGAIGVGIFMPLAFLIPSAKATIALCAPALFFSALPIGSLFSSAQLLFPNQVRGVVGALVLFILNLGGQSLGPLGPGAFNDYLFHNEKMIGPSIALTVGICSILMVIAARATYSPYRKHYRMLHGTP
jgi:MFS family permease